MRRRTLTLGLAAAAGALMLSAPAHAASPTVEVQLGSPRTQVGHGVFVQVVVTSESDAEHAEPEFPDLPGLEISAQGTSFQSSVSFGTGQRTVRHATKTYEYLVLPTQPGKYELAVTVGSGGKKVEPRRIPVLEVTGEAMEDPQAQAAEAGARPSSADDEVFLWPVVDGESVYVGEPLVYRLEIWERANADVQLRSMPSFDDFWVEELETGRRRRDMVARVPYRVHPLLERVLFPQKAGTLTIGGGEVVVTPHGGLGLLRPRRSKPPYQVPGVPLAIEVKPLPAAGQPAGFSANNVGRFAIQTAIDRAQIMQGEAFTLTVTIEGTGNVRFVDPGDWPELTGLRRYDPKEEFALTVSGGKIGGTRTYEFLIVAEDAGTLEIPAHVLPYFDPEREAYVVAESDPIRIDVTPDPDAAPTQEAAIEEAPGDGEAELLADVFVTETLPRSEVVAPWLTPARWTTGALAVPAALGLGLVGKLAYERLTGDEVARARAEKAARRKALVDRAKGAVATGEGFFPALAELLQGVAVERAGPDGVGLPRERLLDLLRARGVPQVELDGLRELLDVCDAARFGAGATDEAKRRTLLHEALALVDARAWKGSST